MGQHHENEDNDCLEDRDIRVEATFIGPFYLDAVYEAFVCRGKVR